MDSDSQPADLKPLISFDSFEDLRPAMCDDELHEFFGNQLRFDKKEARDFVQAGEEFTTENKEVCSDVDGDSSNYSESEDEVDDGGDKKPTEDNNKENVEKCLPKDARPAPNSEIILSFKELALTMFPVREDKMIMKRVIEQGTGKMVPEDAYVVIHYNVYKNFEDEPFDSSYLRNKPLKARFGEGEMIPGLEESIKTMRLHEKSQFLICYKLAYGELGCPPRVPQRANLMYEVKVEEFMEGKVADLLDNKISGADFETVLEASTKFRNAGIECFRKNDKMAVSHFRRALQMLENCEKLKNEEEAKRQKKHLLGLYLNLAVCHNSKLINEPQRATKMCQDALKIDPDNIKAHFHFGKALIVLGDFKEAKHHLLLAKKGCPNDEKIGHELMRLQEREAIAKEKESNMARNMIQEKPVPSVVKVSPVGNDKNDKFRHEIEKRLDKFMGNERMKKLEFPLDLTQAEVILIQEEAHKRDLVFSKVRGNLTWRFVITKTK